MYVMVVCIYYIYSVLHIILLKLYSLTFQRIYFDVKIFVLLAHFFLDMFYEAGTPTYI
jgi:hypothetical protein